MADISQYLNVIQTAASGEAVRDAIIKCMKDINADSAIRATNLVIKTADNVTHTAPKGYAFKNVTVNIEGGEDDPNKTYNYEELSVTNETENQTFPPDDKPNTVYSKVIVNIDWDAIAGDSNIGEYGTITQTKPDPVTGQQYWDAITDGYYAVKRVYLGTGISIPGVNPGGSYPGNDPGGTDGPFTVQFKNEKGVIFAKVPNIPKHGSVYEADSSIDGKLKEVERLTTSKGTFSRWKGGDITNVTYSFTAEPEFTQGEAIAGKSWTDIAKTGGASIAIGQSATLHSPQVSLSDITLVARVPNSASSYATIYLPAHTYTAGFLTLKPMCVGHGEGGTTSSWLSTVAVGKSVNNFVSEAGGTITGPLYTDTQWGCDDVTSSLVYQFMQRILPLFFPEELMYALKSSNGQNYGLDSTSYSIVDIRRHPNDYIDLYGTKDKGKIWLPSLTELRGLPGLSDALTNKYNHWDSGSRVSMTSWIVDDHTFEVNEGSPNDYGSVWFPTDSGSNSIKIATRSATTSIFGPNQQVNAIPKAVFYRDDTTTDPYLQSGAEDLTSWYVGFNL